MRLAVTKDVATLLEPQGNRVENISLLFEKLLLPQDWINKPEQKDEALRRLTETPPRLEYQRRSRSFLRLFHRQYRESALIVGGKVKSRLARNLAGGRLGKAWSALDRLLGAPYIPGSAVKGCCAHAAKEMERAGTLSEESLRLIFGKGADDASASQGLVTFLAAMPLDNIRVSLDILNPHHDPATGRERNPVPVKFPVVEKGGQFVFFLVCQKNGTNPDQTDAGAILNQAKAVLLEAFSLGFGAKTAAGHGWFSEDDETLKTLLATFQRENAEAEMQRAEERRAAEERAAQDRLREEEEVRRAENERKRAADAAAEQARLNALTPEERDREEMIKLPNKEFEKKLSGIRALNEDEQRLVLEVAKTKGRYRRYLKHKKHGPRMREVAQKLGIEL